MDDQKTVAKAREARASWSKAAAEAEVAWGVMAAAEFAWKQAEAAAKTAWEIWMEAEAREAEVDK